MRDLEIKDFKAEPPDFLQLGFRNRVMLLQIEIAITGVYGRHNTFVDRYCVSSCREPIYSTCHSFPFLFHLLRTFNVQLCGCF